MLPRFMCDFRRSDPAGRPHCQTTHRTNEMITRIWHGRTTPENADTYEALLRTEVLIDIKDRNMPGFHGIQVLRRDQGHEVEFIKIMRFESIEAIRTFAGDDYEMAV